jgi:hypothetical protein
VTSSGLRDINQPTIAGSRFFPFGLTKPWASAGEHPPADLPNFSQRFLKIDAVLLLETLDI